MGHQQARKKSSLPGGLTGELMLAKIVIDEKDEMLNQKDLTIRELNTKLQSLEDDAERLRLELSRAKRVEEMARANERLEAQSLVVSDIVRVATQYEDLHGSSSTGLAAKIFSVLQEKYDLRVIDGPSAAVDPRLHQVVAVDHAAAENGSIEVLSNGYRIGDTVIRPALVKVILGLRRGGRAAECERDFRVTHGE